MTPSPSLLMASVILLALLVAILMIGLGLIWSQIRSVRYSETVRLVGELARRQCELEAHWARVGGASHEAPAKLPAGKSEAAGATSSRMAAPRHRVDAPLSNAVEGPTLIAIPSLTPPSQASWNEVSLELGERFGAIWDLSDGGASPEAIARSTGQPIGQVELILALRRQLLVAPGSGPR